MPPKIAITVPIYISNENLMNYFHRLVVSIQTKYEWVLIPVINASTQVLFFPRNSVVLDGRQPQGVAKAWNDGIRKSIELGCKYCIVANQDIAFRGESIDNLIDFMETYSDVDVGSMTECTDLGQMVAPKELNNAPTSLHWSCFVVRDSHFDKFGEFDENFMPAYFEDNDMGTRVTLAGGKCCGNTGSLFYHIGSATLKNDGNLSSQNGTTYEANHQYFLRKWGRDPCGDREELLRSFHHHPYNEQDKDIKYWRH